MDTFGDDELRLVLNWVSDPQDRTSFSQVCKQWLRVEGSTRSSIHVYEMDLLHNFLPRFPNLTTFEASTRLTDADLEFVAKTCPNIEVLNLNFQKKQSDYDEFNEHLGSNDVGDDGICAIATECHNLSKVFVRRRIEIGNFGVISLVKIAVNLRNLDLARCSRVDDRALEAIGSATSIRVLNLQGCSLITDRGLGYLANGSLPRTLKKLIITECDQITDCGVSLLSQMCCLEELNLADCGPKVTDDGCVTISTITSLKRLNFSWLINLTDVTVVAIAENCRDLVSIDLTGCEFITGLGVRAFSNHECLETLILASCYNVFGNDVEHTVLGCPSLKYIGLDKGLRMWMSVTAQQNIRSVCTLDWK